MEIRWWEFLTFYIMGDAIYKKTHRLLGLCQDCSSPAKIRGYCIKHYWKEIQRERRYCLEHREERSTKFKQWRQRNLDAGGCTHCGTPLIEHEKKRCVNCR